MRYRLARIRRIACIQLSGPLEQGDALRLDTLVTKTAAATTRRFVRWLILDSPGGSVGEAKQLADVVRNRILWTSNLHILVMATSLKSKMSQQDSNAQAAAFWFSLPVQTGFWCRIRWPTHALAFTVHTLSRAAQRKALPR